MVGRSAAHKRARVRPAPLAVPATMTAKRVVSHGRSPRACMWHSRPTSAAPCEKPSRPSNGPWSARPPRGLTHDRCAQGQRAGRTRRVRVRTRACVATCARTTPSRNRSATSTSVYTVRSRLGRHHDLVSTVPSRPRARARRHRRSAVATWAAAPAVVSGATVVADVAKAGDGGRIDVDGRGDVLCGVRRAPHRLARRPRACVSPRARRCCAAARVWRTKVCVRLEDPAQAARARPEHVGALLCVRACVCAFACVPAT